MLTTRSEPFDRSRYLDAHPVAMSLWEEDMSTLASSNDSPTTNTLLQKSLVFSKTSVSDGDCVLMLIYFKYFRFAKMEAHSKHLAGCTQRPTRDFIYSLYQVNVLPCTGQGAMDGGVRVARGGGGGRESGAGDGM